MLDSTEVLQLCVGTWKHLLLKVERYSLCLVSPETQFLHLIVLICCIMIDLGWSGWDMGDSALLNVCHAPAGQTGSTLTAGSKEEAKIPTPAPPVLCKPLHLSHLHPIS